MTMIMLDIETLGTEPGCTILQIGAYDGTTEFEITIDPVASTKHGFIIEPRTVMWWFEQSDEARLHVTKAGVNPTKALCYLANSFRWKDAQIWCNGASFDFPILKAAFRMCNLELPWPFYNEMDFRTLKNLINKETFKSLRVQPELAHSALSDAKAQYQTLQNILDYLANNHVRQVA